MPKNSFLHAQRCAPCNYHTIKGAQSLFMINYLTLGQFQITTPFILFCKVDNSLGVKLLGKGCTNGPMKEAPSLVATGIYRQRFSI